MFEIIKQSDPTNTNRRCYFRLIDSTDNVSGKVITTTGVKVIYSKNGASPATSSVADITAIDTGSLPGEYFIEFATNEVDTLGYLVANVKPAGCLAARIQATITLRDQFAVNAPTLAQITGSLPTVAQLATALPSTSSIADGIFDRVDAIETGLTLRGVLRLVGAVNAGTAAGLDTATATFRAAASNSKVRITAAEDGNGNRTISSFDVTT